MRLCAYEPVNQVGFKTLHYRYDYNYRKYAKEYSCDPKYGYDRVPFSLVLYES
jgi:hypothetical protein